MQRRHTRIVPTIGVLAFALAVGSSSRGEKPELQRPSIQRPEDLHWQDGPASLPPGAKIAVLDGDPTKAGPFVMRIKLPDGYKIPPHTHPKPERVTIIAGSFHLGMGDRFDTKHAQELTAGTYGTWPPGMKHFVWVEGETTVQFHGDGPWTIDYLNPADDPRQRK